MWTLLGHMANSRLSKLKLARGSPGAQRELAMTTSNLRQRLSLAVQRANTTLLLERMRQVGDGAQMAAKKRSHWALEEARGKAERQASWLVRVTGSDLVRKGQFMLDKKCIYEQLIYILILSVLHKIEPILYL